MTELRKLVERRAEVNTDRLYGTLQEAIDYLREMQTHLPPDASLYEDWTGYEDMAMAFIWYSLETDAEFFARKAEELRRAADAVAASARDAAKAKRRAQWEALNREFGRGY